MLVSILAIVKLSDSLDNGPNPALLPMILKVFFTPAKV